MATATLSAESTTNKALKAFGIPQRTFGILVGVSNGQLSDYLTGVKKLPNELAQRFYHTISLIKQLTAFAGGLPLDWSPENGKHFRLVLEALDKGQFRVDIKDLTDDFQILNSAAQLAGGMAVLSGKHTEEIQDANAT